MDDVCNVIVLSNAELSALPLGEPKALLRLLQGFNGDIEAFAAHFADTVQNQMNVLYAVETVIKQDPFLHAQWKDAIKQNQIIRLRMLQNEGLKELEGVTLEKPSEILAFSKLVLGDLMAGEISAAKKFDGVPVVPPSNDDKDADDEKDALEAMSM